MGQCNVITDSGFGMVCTVRSWLNRTMTGSLGFRVSGFRV